MNEIKNLMLFSGDIITDTDEHEDRHVVSLPPRPAGSAGQQTSRDISLQRHATRPGSPRPGPSSAPDLPVDQQIIPDPQAALPEEELELDEDILKMLGDAPKPETALGKSIHKDVAKRWNDILLKGLQKEVKEKLLEEYLVPSNCSLLSAPILNPEAKAALPETLVKRDNSILQKQKQLGVALSALAQATDLLLKNETAAQKILQPISDACRILCDSHHLETKTRRYFVTSSINTNLRDTLSDTTRDDHLFGTNVTDKLKAAQAIQKSGDTLKNTPKPFNNRFNKNNFVTNKVKPLKNSLNFKTLHRKTRGRLDAGLPQAPQRARRPPTPPSRPRRPPSSPRRRTYRK